ncbi:hypothetical protein HGA11_07195 [Mycolicibacterium septicum DSM 44393]|uniref:Uncharacterized protein n=1 Tax=Mycolicibacterium septicum DSM 44393 TaxID=1341646 RepID=A0A7X6RVA2_9MYCO|nr:hypothetical protein [Mycolicibacterium septicum DSM 44393]
MEGSAAPTSGNRGRRRFGQLPSLVVPEDVDAPLPDVELAPWAEIAKESPDR